MHSLFETVWIGLFITQIYYAYKGAYMDYKKEQYKGMRRGFLNEFPRTPRQ